MRPSLQKTKEKYKKAVLLLHAFSLIHFKDCRTIDKYEACIIKECISANSLQLIHRVRISIMRILIKPSCSMQIRIRFVDPKHSEFVGKTTTKFSVLMLLALAFRHNFFYLLTSTPLCEFLHGIFVWFSNIIFPSYKTSFLVLLIFL